MSDQSQQTTEQPSKETNNDWSAETTYWGDEFVARVDASGNEAEGEVPHVNAQYALQGHLTDSDTPFSGEKRPDDPEDVHTPEEETRKWTTEGVTLTFSLSGSVEIVGGEFEETGDQIGGALPDDWEVLD